jgi:hypothetical protein
MTYHAPREGFNPLPVNGSLPKIGITRDEHLPAQVCPEVKAALQAYATAPSRAAQVAALGEVARLRAAFWAGFNYRNLAAARGARP